MDSGSLGMELEGEEQWRPRCWAGAWQVLEPPSTFRISYRKQRPTPKLISGRLGVGNENRSLGIFVKGSALLSLEMLDSIKRLGEDTRAFENLSGASNRTLFSLRERHEPPSDLPAYQISQEDARIDSAPSASDKPRISAPHVVDLLGK